jgi:hypothetical protein
VIVLPHLFSPFFRQFPISEGRILSGTMIPPLNEAASNSKVSTLLVGDKQCGKIHAFLKIEKKQSLSTTLIMNRQLLHQKFVK